MKQKGLKFLVTGGAGFIGSHIVDKLLTDGHEVTIIDNLTSGRLENISHHLDDEFLHFIKGDILNLNFIKKCVKDQDCIFHEAAITSVPFSVKNSLITNETNIIGTLNLLQSCLDANVRKFIFASSASVYGEKNISPMKEDYNLYPKSPYAVSKIAGEYYSKLYYELYGLETICLRYFNVYGPRARSNQGVISKFINQILENKSPIIYGDGEQTRDFINVKDVAEANILAMQNQNAVGEVINIGHGRGISINEVFSIISSTLNKKYIKPIYEKSRIGDIRHGYADIQKARDLIGFRPLISIHEGIKECIEYFKENPR